MQEGRGGGTEIMAKEERSRVGNGGGAETYLGGKEKERQGKTAEQDSMSESAVTPDHLGKRQVRVALFPVGFLSFPTLIPSRVETVLFFPLGERVGSEETWAEASQ